MGLPSLSTLFGPPPGYSGPTYTFGQVESIINTEALKNKVDPRLALAYILNESGGNPYAIGDQGTSFGLAQLHQGGELGNLTPAQAFNPTTNLDVSLAEVASVQQANPGLTDPGVIAAKAQRPANQQAYAATVDSLYQQLGGDISGTPGGMPPSDVVLTASKQGSQPGAAPQIDGTNTATLTAASTRPFGKMLASLDALLNPHSSGVLGSLEQSIPGLSLLNPATDAKLILARGTVIFIGFSFGVAGLILLVSSVAGFGASAVNQVQEAAGPVGKVAGTLAATAAVA